MWGKKEMVKKGQESGKNTFASALKELKSLGLDELYPRH